IHAAFDFQIGVRLDAAGGAHGGDASGEIKARGGVGERQDGEAGLGNSTGGHLLGDGVGVVEMIVHADDAGDDGVAGAVENFCARRNLGGGGGADGLNFAVGDDDGLVVFGGRGSAVNDADVIEDEGGSVNADEGGDVGRFLGLRDGGGGIKQRRAKYCE